MPLVLSYQLTCRIRWNTTLRTSLSSKPFCIPLELFQVSSAKQYNPPANNEQRMKDTVEFIQNGQGCQLQGSFPISKVNGAIHISTHSYMDIFFALKTQHHDLFLKLNFSYEIIDLRFGHFEENWKSEKARKMLAEMELSEQLFENYVDHQNNHFDNFIGAFWMELIPYTLLDHTSGLEFKSLQHSFNRKIKVTLKVNSSQRNRLYRAYVGVQL